jgi:gentisate 1,2-dioxygenase
MATASDRAITLADDALPPDVLAAMERLNVEAASLNIWLRTRANAPQKAPWPAGADEPARPAPAEPVSLKGPPPLHRPIPTLWRWAEIEPYLHRIAEIAPLEFTERQQFLLVNPGLGGNLRVTNTIRVAVSIYKPGDVAPTHVHTPNASRTILSDQGGYTTIEGERCKAHRGDLILTPNGTWHGHGNDSAEPVIWMDVLDWPLLEYLDCIWIEEEGAASAGNRPAPAADYSKRMYGAGGLVPRFAEHRKGMGEGTSPMFHYDGGATLRALEGLAGEDGSPHDGILMEFTDPVTGGPAFASMGYFAQLLRPGETTLPSRQTASTLYCVIEGEGVTEAGGVKMAWAKNDIFVVPNHLWSHHVNTGAGNAVLYSVTDAPLLRAIGQYRRQGRTKAGDVITL